jgi:hypothetical protein
LVLVLRSFFPFLLALLFRYGFARRFGKGVRLGGIDILVFFRLLFLPFFQKLEHILISKSPSKYLIIANPTWGIHASFKFYWQEYSTSVVVSDAALKFNFQ